MTALTTLALLLATTPAPAGQHIVGASLFKNGYALITREIDAPASGEYTVQSTPQGSLGTVWFTTTDGVRLMSVVSTTTEKKGEEAVSSLDAVLRANVGREVVLIVRKGDAGSEEVIGKLLAANGEIVVVQTATRMLAISKSSILSVSASNGELKYKAETTTTERALRLKVEASKPGKVYLMALERGVTGAPGYAVDISDPKKLTLTAKATVLNDLDDIDNIEMRFVTGFPNVPYAGVPDPLLSGQSVDQFVAVLGGLTNDFGMTVNTRSRAGEMMTQNAPAFDMGGGMPVSPLEGIQAGDLFFYRQPNLTMKKFDRGYFILFHAEAPYEHLYTWNIADYVVDSVYRPSFQDTPQDVWHSLKFRNTSGQPLTTGAATTFKDGQILGQDMMRYTPVGADAELRVSKALDIRAEVDESEVTRERAALRIPNGGTFDLVTLRGTLTITNRKTEEVKMKVTKSITGEVVASTGSPKVNKTAKGMRDINPRSTLEWTPTIASGKSATLTYDYKLYVRT